MAPLPGWKPLIGPEICPEVSGIPHCDFASITKLISNGMTDLVLISTLIVVLALVIAGFKLVTAGVRGDSGALKDLKDAFMNIVIGYAIILTAWVVVYTITSLLLAPGLTLLIK
jgi:hypothetical protein